MKKKLEKRLLGVLEKVIRLEVQKNESNDPGDPPICPFILHQPKRPRK